MLFVGNHQLFGLDGVHIVEEFKAQGKAARPDAAGVPAATGRRPPASGRRCSARDERHAPSAFGNDAIMTASCFEVEVVVWIAALKRGAKALVFPGGARDAL